MVYSRTFLLFVVPQESAFAIALAAAENAGHAIVQSPEELRQVDGNFCMRHREGTLGVL